MEELLVDPYILLRKAIQHTVYCTAVGVHYPRIELTIITKQADMVATRDVVSILVPIISSMLCYYFVASADTPLSGPHTALAVLVGVGSLIGLLYALFNCACCDESSLLVREVISSHSLFMAYLRCSYHLCESSFIHTDRY